VIRFLTANTVPVALNLYVIRQQKDAAGDFFRGVQRQRPAQYQGLYLVAPDGKVLASHQNFKSEKTWPRELLADLEPGLKAFGPVRPRAVRRRDPLPERGRGVRPDGGATLAVYLRYSIKGVPLREVPDPTIDSLPLTAGELAGLAPPAAAAGTTWQVPQPLARKFSRVLGPADEDSMPRPHEVASATLVGRVLSVEGGVAFLAYEGALSGSHRNQAKKHTHGEVKLTGVGRYDTKAGRLLSLVWVFDGVYRGAPPYNQPAAYSAVAEWTRDGPAKQGTSAARAGSRP
jgi:hypothetical protein